MNDNEKTQDHPVDDTADIPTGRRPLGYWLRAVDGLLTSEFAAAFQNEGVTRRDWMMLNLLAGELDAPEAAERLARKGKRLRRLEDLGWAEEQGDGTWALTDAGREAHARLGEVVSGIRSRVAGAVSDEEFATTLASLEAIARELGWDETRPFAGRRGFGRGFGPGRRFGGPRGFGFGPGEGFGFGPGYGFGPGAGASHGEAWAYGHDDGCHGHGGHRHGHAPHEHGHAPHEHGHGHGHGHGHDRHRHGGHGHDRHGHGGKGGERAFERGFDAGFRRGQEAGAA
ncbi:hypothetical protein MK786_06620 [Microbacterium sp. CFH 31415]|uniref:MarR family winged helix-turn-helix transcriptional regulator n=1 Tax=Microbacterium sp. CFH 31415 TaxID=2921732 RepID=UPI001F13E79E|nr:hypothetical protein [Microbacterium sp. CFH 31415]MCH6230408.1 hypothetical protein [Microbacterium sp. CFH 31415]